MMFIGTSMQQDTRFSDADKKLMKQIKFADCLDQKVDMTKVKLDVLKPWISERITSTLGCEDDVVIEFLYNQLEEHRFPEPKRIQLNMTAFLNGRNAKDLMQELWNLLLSAQSNDKGIPDKFLEEKKKEIMTRLKLNKERIQESVTRKEKGYEAQKFKQRNYRDHSNTREKNKTDYDKEIPNISSALVEVQKHLSKLQEKTKESREDSPKYRSSKTAYKEKDRYKDRRYYEERRSERKKSPNTSKVVEKERRDRRHKSSTPDRKRAETKSTRKRCRSKSPTAVEHSDKKMQRSSSPAKNSPKTSSKKKIHQQKVKAKKSKKHESDKESKKEKKKKKKKKKLKKEKKEKKTKN